MEITLEITYVHQIHTGVDSVLMDKLLLSLRNRILVPVVCLAGILCWLALCSIHYQSYWLGTIAKVQTTDFNLLHHTLPINAFCHDPRGARRPHTENSRLEVMVCSAWF
jgi:hypothetical protein